MPVDRLSLIADEYRQLRGNYSPSSQKKKSEIIEIIFDKYKPKLYKMYSQVYKSQHSVLKSIFMGEIYTSLEKWKGDSKYSTYLFAYLKSVWRKFRSYYDPINIKDGRRDNFTFISLDDYEEMINSDD